MSEITTWNPPAPLIEDWYDAGNWTNGVPDGEKIAVVDRLGVRADKVAVKGLQVRGDATVHLEDLTAEEVAVDEKGFLAPTRMTVSRELVLTGGTLATGQAEVLSGATLRVSEPGDKAINGVLQLHGTGVWNSGGRLVLSNDGLDIDGVLEVQSNATLFHPSLVRLRQPGRIIVAQGCTLRIDGPSFTTEGLVQLSGSTLDLRDGEHVFSPGARVTGAGQVSLSSGSCHTAYVCGCAAQGTGPLTLDPDVTLALAPGDDLNLEPILHGPLTLASGQLDLRCGVLAGRFEVGQNARMLVSGQARKEINGRLRLSGSGVLGGSGRLDLSNDGLDVSGVLEVQTDARLFHPSRVQIRPAGRVVVANGRRLTIDGPSLVTAGTVQLTASTLDLRDGEHAFKPGARLTGNGTVRLRTGACHESYLVGCSLTGSGPVAVDAGITLEIQAGTATQDVLVAGPLAIEQGTIKWNGGTLLGQLDFGAGAGLLVGGSAPRSLNGRLRLGGEGRLACSAPIDVSGEGLRIDGRLIVERPATLRGWSTLLNAGQLTLAAPLALQDTELASSGGLDLGEYTLSLTGDIAHVLTGTIRLTVRWSPGTPDSPPQLQFGHVDATGAITLGCRLEITGGADIDPVVALPIVVANACYERCTVATPGWRADHSTSAVLVRRSTAPRFPGHARLDPGFFDDSELAGKLNQALQGSPALAPLPVALVIFATDGAPRIATRSPVNARPVTYVGSVAKLAIMQAAYQLRQDLLDLAASMSLGPGADLLAKARQTWGLGSAEPPLLADIIKAEWRNDGWVAEFRDTGASWESLDALDNRCPSGGTLPPQVQAELRQLAFGDRLKLTISWSNNYAATACLRQLGLAYVAAVVQDTGLYDPRGPGGIWLGNGYGPPGDGYGPQIVSTGDPISGRSHGGTPRSLATFLTLLRQRRLAAPGFCDQMLDLLLDRADHGGWRATYSPFEDGLALLAEERPDQRVYSKLGVYRSRRYDCAMIVAGIQNAPAYIAVGLDAVGDEPLEELIRKLDAVVIPPSP